MELKAFLTVFGAVFLAELGDKTQLATMLFATDQQISKWIVFSAACAALVLATGLGVLAGDTVERFISPQLLNIIAGSSFLIIGGLIMLKALT